MYFLCGLYARLFLCGLTLKGRRPSNEWRIISVFKFKPAEQQTAKETAKEPQRNSRGSFYLPPKTYNLSLSLHFLCGLFYLAVGFAFWFLPVYRMNLLSGKSAAEYISSMCLCYSMFSMWFKFFGPKAIFIDEMQSALSDSFFLNHIDT